MFSQHEKSVPGALVLTTFSFLARHSLVLKAWNIHLLNKQTKHVHRALQPLGAPKLTSALTLTWQFTVNWHTKSMYVTGIEGGAPSSSVSEQFANW